jgi:uncharacterized membrane protein YidH (DUF202 family)
MNTDSDTGRSAPLPEAEKETESDLARMRTELAADRTDLALIRTGFTASSFGAGLTQIIGRGVWPNLAVNLLTIFFILAGAISVQVGLVRLQKRLKASPGPADVHRVSRRLMVIGVSMVQLAMLTIVILVVIHM